MLLVKKAILHIWNRLMIFLKWLIMAVISGLIVGLAGAIFYLFLDTVTRFRTSHPGIILALPLGGIMIVFLYNIMKEYNDQGTNRVLESIQSNTELPARMTPLIFLATILTHLFGGSAGREGAAIQLGGSLGNMLGKLLKLDDFDRRVYIMCGISAAFSALFGTPVAAAIFSMEVISIGIMYYSALVPCAISSLIACNMAKIFGNYGEEFHVLYITNLTPQSGLQTIILAAFCGGVSVLFCILMHKSGELFKKYFKNPYIRIISGAIIIVVLTCIFRTTDYNGAGIDVMEKAFRGEVRPEAFLLKMIFTAITLSCGFKGGEIVPTFFIGATLGCFIGQFMGISSSLCAAIGMISMFCGVTNCPITSLIISIELFGMEGINYYFIAIAVSYMLSGYYGLYSKQKIIYSKYKTEYINTRTH